MKKINRKLLRCLHCGWEWFPKTERFPKRCASQTCKSKRWFTIPLPNYRQNPLQTLRDSAEAQFKAQVPRHDCRLCGGKGQDRAVGKTCHHCDGTGQEPGQ